MSDRRPSLPVSESLSSSASAAGSRRSRLRLVAVGVALLVAASLAACGSGADKPDSQPTEGGSELAALWPLTGLPVKGETPKHPVMIVKIDNSSSSRPQVGTGKADLITEELVEGGMTRLAVAFYSKLPKTAGPVRSMRASDFGIVKPTHGVLVGSGAAPPTIERLNQEKVTYYSEGGPGYYRDSSRRSPYNLMVKMPELAKAVKKKSLVPASYLPWGDEEDFTGTKPATKIQASFSRSHTTSWQFKAGTYTNQNSNATDSDHFTPDTVLVLRVRVGDAGYSDPAGNPVPETLYKGKGKAMIFHGGKMMPGTWNKKSLESPLKLKSPEGEVKVPAGRVWIELVPVGNDGGNVAFQP